MPVGLVTTLLACPTLAANTDGQASAIILPSLTTAVTDGLEFGAIAPSQTSASTVTVHTAGANISTCGIGLTCPEDGDRATLTVTGAPNYRISVTGPTETLLTDGQGNSMRVDGYEIGTGSGTTGSNFRLDAGGAINLYLGATLHVDANQPSGLYAGSFTITTSYE